VRAAYGRALGCGPRVPFKVMAAYLLRRLAYALLVGLGITAITFFISQVIPIDPAAAALGENAREEQIREFRERYGLDKPILVQYGLYLQRLLQLDLGRSLRTGRPVAEDLKEFFPATLELALAAFLVALALGLPAGIWAALRQNRPPDLLVRFLALLLGSTPVFFLAILLLDLLHRRLGLFPGPGRLDPFLIPPPRGHGGGVPGCPPGPGPGPPSWMPSGPPGPAGFGPGVGCTAALLARMVRAAMLDVLASRTTSAPPGPRAWRRARPGGPGARPEERGPPHPHPAWGASLGGSSRGRCSRKPSSPGRGWAAT
jgi:peptide/nickel transport system permease protein